MRKRNIVILISVFLLSMFLCACGNDTDVTDTESTNTSTSEEDTTETEIVQEEDLATATQGFTELSLKDFAISSGDYVGGTLAGEYNGKTLDKTLVTVNVTFQMEGQAFLMIGGKQSWGGFGISTFEEIGTGVPTLRLYDTMSQGESRRFESILFYSDIAGTTLIGEEIKLQVSIEYVDYNEDGMTNDLKLGFWFNGKLYDNKYVYLEDYTNTRHSMGTWMTIRLNDKAPISIH